MGTDIERNRISRPLKKFAAVFLLFRCLDRPLYVTDVARLLEIDRDTVRNHLRLLIALGLIARPSLAEGFVLTDKGRQYWLEEFSAATLDIPPLAADAVLEDSDIVNSIKKIIDKSGAPAPPLNAPPSGPPRRKPRSPAG